MAEEGFRRKLTAILSADVEGYSRLMGEDEDATIRTLTAYRELMSTLIQKHHGRVVDSPGDNLLAEFLSVVDAVRCAVEIQEELRVRNAELPENRKMVFRIGINLGDVVEEGERIYGDGVNITARVEGLAEGGGICISGTVYDSIKNKLSLGYDSLGEHTVKNIKEPVRVYRMRVGPDAAASGVSKEKKPAVKRWQWAALAAMVVLILGAVAVWNFYFRLPSVEPASVEKMAFPLPDKPSIAVLPFANISGDPGEDYFSDGITEEIITGLAKVPRLFVIARNSTFTYKGKPVKVQQVAEDLGVRYVLEGSVRKAKDRVRITAKLVDAMTGKYLWAEKYDRDLKDIFALQDEIMMKIIAALQVKLTSGEQALIVAGGTNNFEAYVKFLQGMEYATRFNKDGNLLARKMAQEAIALDPSYPRGYRLLASTHWQDVALGISKSLKQSLVKAAELYQKVISMDPSEATAHALLGFMYTLMGQHEKGIVEAEKGVALNPNAADALAFFGLNLHYSGRQKEAIEAIKKAIRLNPFPRNWYFMNLGYAYCHAGMYEEAIEALKKALRDKTDNLYAHSRLAAAYSLSGYEQEARAEAAEVLRINPKFSLKRFAKAQPYKNPHDRTLIIDAMRKAGLPETPPLPLPDKPSIAVLPFENMSGDPEQEYFSDVITGEIITALAKLPSMFVIARNSTFTYKGKPVKVQKIAEDLGVRYVLEGSLQKSGDRVRISARLIDAINGKYLWAEKYDRDRKDLFALQDEITMKIIIALEVELTDGERARLLAKGTNNIEAYIKVKQGWGVFQRHTKEDNVKARQLFHETIALDLEYPHGYSGLGWTHMVDARRGWSESRRESMEKALEMAQKANAMDKNRIAGSRLLSYIYRQKRQYEKSMAEIEKWIQFEPNNAGAYLGLASVLYALGRGEETIASAKKAIRLDPKSSGVSYYYLGMGYWVMGQYEEAIAAYKKALHYSPTSEPYYIVLTATYSLLDREEEARTAAAEVLKLNPKFSVDRIAKTLPFKNKAYTERYVNALRKAGLN